jgi:glucosamine--fructose-6-phosphate aminotransferase (isomerizing)
LSASADTTLGIGAAEERAVAATKSFMLSVTCAVHLIAEWARDRALLGGLQRLPEAFAACAQVDWSGALEVLSEPQDAYVVGRGAALPIAQELALKLKEVCGIHAEATSAAELLHGPIAIASVAMPALVLEGDERSAAGVRDAVARLHSAGAPVLLLAAQGQVYEGVTCLVQIPQTQHRLLQSLVAMQAAYPFLGKLARARGRNPDQPAQLMKITRTM